MVVGAAPSDAYSAGQWCEMAGVLALALDAAEQRAKQAEKERDRAIKEARAAVPLINRRRERAEQAEAANQWLRDDLAVKVETIARLEAELAGLRYHIGHGPDAHPNCPVCSAALAAFREQGEAEA